jgi:hypothetical protein
MGEVGESLSFGREGHKNLVFSMVLQPEVSTIERLYNRVISCFSLKARNSQCFSDAGPTTPCTSDIKNAVEGGLWYPSIPIFLAQTGTEAQHELHAFDFVEPVLCGRRQLLASRHDQTGRARGPELAGRQGSIAVQRPVAVGGAPPLSPAAPGEGPPAPTVIARTGRWGCSANGAGARPATAARAAESATSAAGIWRLAQSNVGEE